MKIKQKMPCVGAHVSMAKGFDVALRFAVDLGCNTAQIFTHSNRQWAFKLVTDEQAEAFFIAQKETKIEPVIVHASYLLNIGSANRDVVTKSLAALVQELHACAKLAVPYLVIHSGSNCGGGDKTACCRNISTHIDRAYELFAAQSSAKKTPMILFEISAGQGQGVGDAFEHLTMIRHACAAHKHVGFAFDSAHAFAAGYDLRTPETYAATWNQFDSIVGLKHVHVIHCNDSKSSLGSHVDRHAHVGEGELGMTFFRLLMNDQRFESIPKIVETKPGQAGNGQRRDIALLRALVR